MLKKLAATLAVASIATISFAATPESADAAAKPAAENMSGAAKADATAKGDATMTTTKAAKHHKRSHHAKVAKAKMAEPAAK